MEYRNWICDSDDCDFSFLVGVDAKQLPKCCPACREPVIETDLIIMDERDTRNEKEL
jgi:hypothetical protein